MPRGFGSKVEEEDETVVQTPPETVGPVTVVTEEPKVAAKKGDKDLIRVKAKERNGRVVAWEKDERHPGGQAWVCGDGKECDVYPTSLILRLVKEGSLQRVNWNS